MYVKHSPNSSLMRRINSVDTVLQTMFFNFRSVDSHQQVLTGLLSWHALIIPKFPG